MKEGRKSIWKEQRIFHMGFAIFAITAFWKSGSLWGFVMLGISLGFTVVAFLIERRILKKRANGHLE